MELAVELAKEGALAIRHVADRIQMLPDEVSLLLVAAAVCTENFCQPLCRLFQAPRRAMLRLGLGQEVHSDDEEGVDGIVSSIQGRRVAKSAHNSLPARFVQSASTIGFRFNPQRNRDISRRPRHTTSLVSFTITSTGSDAPLTSTRGTVSSSRKPFIAGGVSGVPGG